MLRLGRSEFNLGRQMSIEEIEASIDAVTRDAVVELASELFTPENLGLCVLGPLEESDVRRQPDARVA
jgi:predicted Zn-dependent peptidase